MKTYKWTVEFTIDQTWVEDGFNMTSDRAHDILAHALPYADGSEFKAKTTKAPSKTSIMKAQGYNPKNPRDVKRFNKTV